MVKNVSDVRPALLAEVEKILSVRQGTGGEFGFEQQTALDYAKKFSHLSLSNAEKMKEEIEKLEIKSETAAKIVDMLPKNRSLLLLILAKERSDFSEKKIEQIEEIIARFCKKEKKKEIGEKEEKKGEEKEAEKAGEKEEKETPPEQ